MKLSTPHLLDGSAIGLSGLCLIHCLALPVAAAFAPLLGVWSEAEWVHLTLVLLAAPLSAGALLLTRPRRPLAIALAATGLALMATALSYPDAETLMTVAGGLTLAGGHLVNWRGRAVPPHAHST
ncbi:MerC domain-containing protein [Phenylobacterium sp.]|uniref:MerC domain-containing protein n=1 Tax=Phenylobacterium sp. TaxID=1871053 RepID=UPI002732266D|nr:MerC domain-containing protein [Phenylobacterium sp.]MDP1874908.1 MerC domain-containing protein [Phenylobacterium sp.]MDP3300003.1 MerC domain-containing protein [Phenylobacterium sp.]